jgi:hypothetical protein
MTDQQAWSEHWDVGAIPFVLVFDRDGKLAKKFDRVDPDNQLDYADVEKFVAKMLAK